MQIFRNLNEGLLNKLNIVDKRCKHLIEKHGFQKVIEQLKTQIYNNKSNCLTKTLLQYIKPLTQELHFVHKVMIGYDENKNYLLELVSSRVPAQLIGTMGHYVSTVVKIS